MMMMMMNSGVAPQVMPGLQVKATWSHGQAVRWLPAVTESGACYVTNSIAIADVLIKYFILLPTLIPPSWVGSTCL
jgi:hypothetical protein